MAMMKIRMRRAARQRAERVIPKWKRAFGYLGDTYQPDPGPRHWSSRRTRRCWPVGRSATSPECFNDAGAYGLTGKPWTASTVTLFLRDRATPGCAPTTARSSARAPGPRWWTNPRGAQCNPCSTRQDGHPGRKTVRRHLLTGVLQCGKCGHHLGGQCTADERIAYGCRPAAV